MSSSAQPSYPLALPVSSFSYRDVGSPGFPDGDLPDTTASGATDAARVVVPGISPQEVEILLKNARAETIAETQKRMQAEAELRSAEEAAKSVRTLELFQEEKKNYFTRVEAEVVHLALAVAARILHREAQVDPMMIAGLVHVALEKLQNGSSATVRVAPGEGARWRERMADLKKEMTISVIEDSDLKTKDCVLETDLGTADFSIDAQLKEVEQGFCDLLALKPQSR